MTPDDAREERRPPTRSEVRAALMAFSDMIRRFDADGTLFRHLPLLMGRLGDLRHMLFEYEVRVTERLLPSESATERESRRIVREARERDRELGEEWSGDEGEEPEDDAGA